MCDNEGMFDAVKLFDPQIIILFAHVGTKSFRKIVDWAKGSGRKVIMWTCFWEPYYITGYKRLIRDFAINRFYNKADYHIAYSSTAKEKLVEIGYPDTQIAIAYNGIDLDLYENELGGVNGEELFDRDSINFLYCGGMGKDKKVDLLIKAIHISHHVSHHKLNAYLIGDGPTFEECKNLVKSLGLADNVKLLGRINNVGKYIQAADCIVLPGTGGLILNEAVLMNKPMIVSKADGTENDLLINGFNGLKFQAGNEESLANAIVEVADNLSFFSENAACVSEVVTKRSNVDMMVTTFLKAIKKVNNENISSSRRQAELYENSAYLKSN
ncbi:glycosyltransferase [Chitinophagaceae bacterium LB-8]|uniref:Glycosyltransferase n=1 Tax=Paraflavisolibacter caeni TaxID=2982496 RepID=A0A9X2XTE7_9BACT|nr:glycosyltransferase [Paraflavisolibacter caeni]MCU7548275.1 glycosyltransferase [Paraflavisolibacter caeni]